VKQLSTKRFAELVPEFGYKLWSAVRHYNFWNPVQTENTSNIYLGISDDRVVRLDWQKMSCWGLALKCYKLRIRQHQNMLLVNAFCSSKHYFPKDIMIFEQRS
jgi:hypothetical protein